MNGIEMIASRQVAVASGYRCNINLGDYLRGFVAGYLYDLPRQDAISELAMAGAVIANEIDKLQALKESGATNA